ncbi:hypothetical protein CPB84DRAFT_1311767 [Gymnopilus junonius]|uniref:Uncharacterized protein n=1 Tax=Gymnopilus junonius TaxID=109634 RepID=A0A9P5NKQ6_GYMJU|nr:hypothetical protein CPB84DRAFT_1311767 [Gymnopilus junonius]
MFPPLFVLSRSLFSLIYFFLSPALYQYAHMLFCPLFVFLVSVSVSVIIAIHILTYMTICPCSLPPPWTSTSTHATYTCTHTLSYPTHLTHAYVSFAFPHSFTHTYRPPHVHTCMRIRTHMYTPPSSYHLSCTEERPAFTSFLFEVIVVLIVLSTCPHVLCSWPIHRLYILSFAFMCSNLYA